jgi:glycosyltransferase involved in cell wall biosynthesis
LRNTEVSSPPGLATAQPARLRITIFANTVSTRSIDRYTGELAANFPMTVSAKPVYFYPQSAGIRKHIDRYWGYIRLARKEQGDYNVIASEGCAYLLMGLPHDRTICVCHDLHGLTYSGRKNLRHRLYDLRYKWSLRFLSKSKCVVTVSLATKRELLRLCPWIPEDKVIVVHNGIEDRWQPIAAPEALVEFRQEYQLTGKRIILHVGDDVFYKNVPAVIRAFAQLTEADLLLVQAGTLTSETQNLIDTLGIRGRFRHLTRLSDGDLVRTYNISEVLVFPSISEGFGWPPLEAMACGCPVIASNCASLPEVCGDACLYVNPTDIAQIANAIERILSEKDCRDLLKERGQRQAAKYSWKDTAAEFLGLFQQP